MITEYDKNALWLESLSVKNKSMSLVEIDDVNEALLVRRALSKRRLIIEKEMQNIDVSALKKIEQQLELNGFLKDSLAYKAQQLFNKNFKAFGSGAMITYLISLTLSVETVILKGTTPATKQEKNETKDQQDYSIEISESSSDPFALANSLQSRAWASGLETVSIPEANGINLYIKNITNDPILSNLKIQLDIKPDTTGTVKIKIIKIIK